MNYYLPLILVIASNTVYHISAKSTPSALNTFVSLTVTYTVGALCSLLLYFVTTKDANLLSEMSKLNWSSLVMGLAVVGLEAGYILMYKAGWNISTAQIIQSSFLAIILIAIGYLVFKEAITLTKVIGAAICLVGLYLINK